MRVGENNYKIIGISDYLDDKLEVDGTESYGVTYFDTHEIYIYTGLKEKAGLETLRHEITHAYLNEYMENKKTYNVEEVCEIIGKYGKTIVEKADKEAEKLWKR